MSYAWDKVFRNQQQFSSVQMYSSWIKFCCKRICHSWIQCECWWGRSSLQIKKEIAKISRTSPTDISNVKLILLWVNIDISRKGQIQFCCACKGQVSFFTCLHNQTLSAGHRHPSNHNLIIFSFLSLYSTMIRGINSKGLS